MCQSCNGINSAKHQRLSKRYKLWQLPTYTHCPVIGTCLTLDELVKVVRQTGLLVEQGSDYYLHSSLVQLADQNVPPSRRIQKILDSKYSRWIKSYGALTTDAERKKFWHDAVKTGQVPGAFWAVISHTHSPASLVDLALGDVHMLSHLQGALNRADLQYMAKLEQEVCTLRDKLERQQIQHQKSQQQSNRLVTAQEKALQSLRQQIRPDENGPSNVQKELESVRRKYHLVARQKDWALKQLQQRLTNIKRLEARQEALVDQLLETTQERDALESTVENLLQPGRSEDEHNRTARLFDLNGRKLAYVGGRTALFPRLKSFVEAHNGQFYCHDGGIEDSHPELSQCLSKADMVFCPIDCVSHNACLQVKKYCKRNSKRFIPLRSASLATFTYQLKQNCEAIVD